MPIIAKELLAPGKYYTREGVLDVKASDLLHFCDVGNRMVKTGLQIPVPLEHQESAEPKTKEEILADRVKMNAGWVHDYYMAGDHLWVNLDIGDPKIAEKIPGSIRFVSPHIVGHYMDGAGTIWRDCIRHIALTSRPVWSGQSPFGTPAPAASPPLAFTGVRLAISHNSGVTLSLDQLVGQPLLRRVGPHYVNIKRPFHQN